MKIKPGDLEALADCTVVMNHDDYEELVSKYYPENEEYVVCAEKAFIPPAAQKNRYDVIPRGRR